MYDKNELLKENKDTKTRLKFVEKENKVLNGQIGSLKNELKQTKIHCNEIGQYQRTAHNIKICNIPFQKGEEKSEKVTNEVTKGIVVQLCQKVGAVIDPNDIDVCHRLGRDPLSPILLRFTGKGKRFDLYDQRNLFTGLTSKTVDLPCAYKVVIDKRAGLSRGRGSHHGPQQQKPRVKYIKIKDFDNCNVFLQEHLTYIVNFENTTFKRTITST